MIEDTLIQYQKMILRYNVSYRGMIQQRGGKKHPTWRIELIDKNGEATDIWSECWLLEDKTWTGSYRNKNSPTLIEALMNALQSLLEYCGLDEVDP